LANNPNLVNVGSFNEQLAKQKDYPEVSRGIFNPRISGRTPKHWDLAVNYFTSDHGAPLTEANRRMFNKTAYNEFLKGSPYGTLTFHPVPMKYIVDSADLYKEGWRSRHAGVKLPRPNPGRFKASGVYSHKGPLNLAHLLSENGAATIDAATLLKQYPPTERCVNGKVLYGKRKGLCRLRKKPKKK